MLRYENDRVVLRSGYWNITIDTTSSRVVRLAADAMGLGHFCQEMLDDGLGGESVLETATEFIRSGRSRTHTTELLASEGVLLRNVKLGDVAELDVAFRLHGDNSEIFRVELSRRILRSTAVVTDMVFGLQCLREFAFWSTPALRQGHDPAAGFRPTYSQPEDIQTRRVVGWHDRTNLERFIVHGSPSYPDLELRIEHGCYHLETQYLRHVSFGLSSGDFRAGAQELVPGEQSWVIEFRPIPQGELAPVAFESGDARLNRFVPAFFDGYLLSGVACDHEYFGNNPSRHAYCPGAIHHMTRGFMITASDRWDDQQGLIEERWKTHIRRTLAEGMSSADSFTILMDSGVWQNACGAHVNGTRPLALDLCFVLACCQVLLKSGDQAFAREIVGTLEPVIAVALASDKDGDGLLEGDSPGTPGSPSTSYNDAMSMGHKDGYLNAIAYETFLLFASLADWLGENVRADHLKKAAARIKLEYNRQLWNEAGGRYVGWIDAEGKSHDFWFTFTNFLAVAAGIVPEERLGRLMESFFNHPNHHRIFAAGMNLDPVTDGSYRSKSSIFGLWLDGGILLGPASFELYARALYGGEHAWNMLNDLVAQWEQNSLSVTPLFDWCRKSEFANLKDPRLRLTGGNAYTWIDGIGATGAGTEPYLSDGGAMLWALYAGILGIRTDFQGIHFVPHLPRILHDVKVGCRMMGRNFTIQYRGYGDGVGSVRLNGNVLKHNRSQWDEVPEGSRFEIEVRSS